MYYNGPAHQRTFPVSFGFSHVYIYIYIDAKICCNVARYIAIKIYRIVDGKVCCIELLKHNLQLCRRKILLCLRYFVNDIYNCEERKQFCSLLLRDSLVTKFIVVGKGKSVVLQHCLFVKAS